MITALLTIDDIASENTPAIVDYLDENGIPAIMFAWGKNVKKQYENALYALKKGIIVGNHSYSHPHFSELSFDACVKEIEECERVLDGLYHDAGIERKYRPFRFPFGDKGGENKEALQKYLAESGFHKVDDRKITYLWWKGNGLDRDIDTFWTFDFAEYNIRPGSGFTLKNVTEKMRDPHPSSGAALFEDGASHILLLHAHDETEKMVPGYYKRLLDELIGKGVKFVKPAFLNA